MNDELMHIGMPRRSGRYRWGSGKRPYQSSGGENKEKSTTKTKKVRIEDLSDEDLQKKVNRLNLENSYYDAVKKNRANKKKDGIIKKTVRDILIDSSKVMAKELVTSYSRELGKKLVSNSDGESKKSKK